MNIYLHPYIFFMIFVLNEPAEHIVYLWYIYIKTIMMQTRWEEKID